MSLQKQKKLILAAIILPLLLSTLVWPPYHALSRASADTEYTPTATQAVTIIDSKPMSNKTPGFDKGSANGAEPIESSPPQVSYNFGSTKMGVYTGAGDIQGHTNFQGWLGKPVPYATDYIDYKGGWTKDFIDSKLWLMQPWGRWVSQTGGRLVLGVPMLESGNAGQFDTGASGAFDFYFRDLASELVANNLGDSIIRLGYEANCDTIGPWQATDNPSGYRSLFRHEVAVMRSVPDANFLFDWTVCNGLQNGHTLNSFDSFYPGDDVVGIIGIDIYDVDWGASSVTPQERWSYITNRQMGVNELIAYARAHGKPLSYPEWGLYAPGDSYDGGGDDPYFIQKMAELISTTGPVYQAYFNYDWGGGMLANFPKGQAAFKQIFGQ